MEQNESQAFYILGVAQNKILLNARPKCKTMVREK